MQAAWALCWDPSLLCWRQLWRVGTTCRPIGARAISANLMCWIPKGMPMIVTKQAKAEVRWPIASYRAGQQKPDDIADEAQGTGAEIVLSG